MDFRQWRQININVPTVEFLNLYDILFDINLIIGLYMTNIPLSCID